MLEYEELDKMYLSELSLREFIDTFSRQAGPLFHQGVLTDYLAIEQQRTFYEGRRRLFPPDKNKNIFLWLSEIAGKKARLVNELLVLDEEMDRAFTILNDTEFEILTGGDAND